MPTPSESPKKHVAGAPARQAKATKEAKDKAEILAVATDALSRRVGTLADAVLINNSKIDEFQKELNKKPDDTEVQFITGMANEHRKSLLWTAIATGVGASILSGAIALSIAERDSRDRCLNNSKNINTIVRFLEGLPDPDDSRFQPTIDELKANRNSC